MTFQTKRKITSKLLICDFRNRWIHPFKVDSKLYDLCECKAGKVYGAGHFSFTREHKQ